MKMPALFNLRQTLSVEFPRGVTAVPLDSHSVRLDLIIAASICLFLTTSTIGARLFMKVYHFRRIQWEDCSILLSYACFASFVGTLFLGALAGQGHHQGNVSQNAFKRVLLYANISAILYAPSILFAKVAILFHIERDFSTVRKNLMRWAVSISFVFCVLAYTAIFFVNVLPCTPRAKITDPLVNGKCINQETLNIATGAVDIFSNIVLLLLPLYGITQLHFPVQRKLGVALLFGCGVVVCAASGARLYYNLKLNGNSEFTTAIWPVNMWSLTEITLLIVIACCPTLPSLVDRIRRKPMKRTTYPQVHSQWISTTISREGSPNSSKTQIFYPAPSESTISNEPSIRESLPKISSESIALPERPSTSLEAPAVPFEPFERPISHLSYDSYTTAAIAELLEDTPVSPISYMSPTSPQIRHATEMSVTPVRFGGAKITKTVDVRVSNHTNPGSPIKFGRPDW